MTLLIDRMDASITVPATSGTEPSLPGGALGGLEAEQLQALLAPLIRALIRQELADYADEYFRTRG